MPTFRERNGRVQAIVRVKKNGVLVHTESQTFPSRRLAESWAERVERQIQERGVPARVRNSHTMLDLIGSYIKLRQRIRPLGKSLYSDLDLLTRHLGHHRLDALTAAVFHKFALARKDEGAGPTTILHNLATAASMLGAAKAMLDIDVSDEPVRQAMKVLRSQGAIAKSDSRERRTSDAELAKLVADFERLSFHPSTEIPMQKIVPLAVALPRRREELCNMMWVDYDGRTVTLRDTKHPTRPRTEVVPVPPDAAKIIDSLPRIDARILPYKPESVTASFVRAVRRLGLPDLRFHDLRHEGISRLFERGLSIQEVSLVSGHLSWNMLRRYTHLQPDQVLEKLK